MLYILLLYLVQRTEGTSSWECIALDGERVPHGETFVPGPDYCTVCRCEKGDPRLCQAVLCQPPQDCKSFRVGKSCCDFICLDDMLPKLPGDGNGPNASTDLGLRMVASAVTAILSLALLLFLIHRLRQRRVRAQQQYYDDPDSPVGPNVDSCHSNACCHNAAYCSGNDHVDFFLDGHPPPHSLWKQPSFYFSYEDAPPPYSEVVGSSYRLSESGALPALGPIMVQLGSSLGESSDSQGAAVGAASSGSGLGRPSSPSRTPLNRNVIMIRSDEVYEDVNATPDELPPPYCPTAQPLNDLNRGADVRIVDDQTDSSSERRSAREIEGSVECSCDTDDAYCSLCSANSATADIPLQQEQVSPSPVRLRTREVSRSSSQRASNRASTLEEFQLRLSMDISDSSTSSEGPTRTFSSSSDDSTSMDTTSEMR